MGNKERSDFVCSAEDSHKQFLYYLSQCPQHQQLALQNGDIALEEFIKLQINGK